MEDSLVTELFATTPQQLQTILEGMDAGVLVRDADDRLLYANSAAARLLGYPSPEALLRAPLGEPAERFRVVDEQGRPLTRAELPGQRLRRGEDVPETLLHFWDRESGEEHWSRVTTTPIFDQNGALLQIVSIFRDVTAQRQAEEARQRLAFLAEASQILASSLDYEATLATVAQLTVPQLADWCAVHIVDEDGDVRQLAVAHVDPNKVRYARELEERYPYDPDAATGVPNVLRTRQAEIVPEISDDLLVAAALDEELLTILRELSLRSSMVVPLLARDRVLGAITMVAAESGRRYGPDDLSLAEELAARAALAVDNARLYRESTRTVAEQAAILEHMTDGVVLVDQNGIVRYLNPAGQTLTGFEAIGWAVEDFLFANRAATSDGQTVERGQGVLARAFRGETVLNAERQIVRPDGKELVLRVSAAPIVTDDGTRLGAVGVFHDVTAEWDLEQQKDAFLAAAAHDLKNPLTAIKGLAQMLERLAEREGQERMAKGLGQIDRATTRMTRLVNELLDTTRLQMGSSLDLNLARVDLVALVRSVADEFQGSTERHRILVEAAAPHLTATWDPDRLERVLANLLSNAIKYSPHGGDISIGVSEEKGEAVIVVQDWGLGIPADDLPHVFERFYRARNVEGAVAGTGIGLSGVKHIVELHGGTISVESREGQGATFTIRLPLGTDEGTRG